MINSDELRIGNIVWESSLFTPGPDDFEQIVVGAINDIDKVIRDNQGNGYSYDTLYPIPLTPEWLERFGFTIPDEHGYMMRVNKGVVRIKIDDRLKFPSVKIGDLHCAVTPFVHQLQNLYFALTGEELRIK